MLHKMHKITFFILGTGDAFFCLFTFSNSNTILMSSLVLFHSFDQLTVFLNVEKV